MINKLITQNIAKLQHYLRISVTILIVGITTPLATANEINSNIEIKSANALTNKISFNIQSQSLDTALLEFSEQAKMQVMVATPSLDGITTSGVTGTVSIASALRKLLKDTGLQYNVIGDTITVTSDANTDTSKLRARPIKVASASGSGYQNGQKKPSNDTITSSGNILEEIIVTAQRRSESLQDVPIAVDLHLKLTHSP